MGGDRMAAVDTIRRRARMASATARARIGRHGLADDVDDLAAMAAQNGRITVNFHPDRLDRFRRTVAAGLLADGRYRTQYDTWISNGQRFAVVGGLRARWESELFGPEFDPGGEGPIYGALDLTRDPHGGSPRFGSSFLVLRQACLERTTFCFGDSHIGPTDVGTIDEFDSVLAGLVDDAATGNGLDRGLSVVDLARALGSGTTEPARSLDGYVEAQVHGGIDLRSDVTALVADPSFRSSPVASDLEAAADRYDVELRWHRGSELDATAVPGNFRGPSMPELALLTAREDGVLDAAAIGLALVGVDFSPPLPAGDPEGGPLQQYKKLWHCLLRYGSDAEPG